MDDHRTVEYCASIVCIAPLSVTVIQHVECKVLCIAAFKLHSE